MLVLIDNFDSFTHNLADYLMQLGLEVKIVRNDVSLQEIIKLKPTALVISPGPETPQKAGITMKAIAHFHDKIPLLGICLGHQAIGEFFGAKIKKCKKPMHGKISKLKILSKYDIYKGFKKRLQVTRYHSLALKNMPNTLQITSISEDDNEIMSFKHKYLPITGIQFHPEAYLTQNGLDILKNWAIFSNAMMSN